MNKIIISIDEFFALAEFVYDVPTAKAIQPHDGPDYASDLLSAVQSFYGIDLRGRALIDFLEHAPAVFEASYGFSLNRR